MQIDHITADALRRLLRALTKGNPPPIEFLELQALQQTGDDAPSGNAPSGEKEMRLRDLLQRIVEQNLQRCRLARNVAAGTPGQNSGAAAAALQAGLPADFRAGDAHLEAWSALYYRFFDPQPRSVGDFSRTVNIDERQLRRRVEQGLIWLAEELRRAERQAQASSRRQQIQRHLPPADYERLFGVAGLLEQIETWLTRPDGPRFVSIEGLGGIGKTALARSAAYCLAQQADLEGIAWISARQEQFSLQNGLHSEEKPARSLDDLVTRLAEHLGQDRLYGLPTAAKLEGLKSLLAQRPYLVVLDNLETLEDADSVAPAFHPLARTSRFLVTSRYSLSHFDYVQSLVVPELSLADSRALLEKELDRRGSRALLNQAALADIYQTVGGLPLALKLLAAQLGRLPVTMLLQSFETARRPLVGTLYSFIYRHTWALLSDPARQLLLSMLDISPEGEDIEWLQMMSGLSGSDFEAALDQLIDYSLLETSGMVDNPIYRLHRITITFLHTEVLQDWGETL